MLYRVDTGEFSVIGFLASAIPPVMKTIANSAAVNTEILPVFILQMPLHNI